MKLFIVRSIFHFAVLISSMLIAVQMRYDLRYGHALGPKYEAQPLHIYVLMGAALVITFTIQPILSHWQRIQRLDSWFVSHVLATGVSSIAILVLSPDISQLQTLYFFGVSLFLGVVTIIIPNQLRIRNNLGTIASNISVLWQNRALIQLWMKYNIETRYSQRILGILWIILIPLSTGFVIALVFGEFLRIQLDVPLVVFFFSAFTIYNIFNQGITAGSRSIVHAMGIINQVSFPREVLVLVTLGETLIDTMFMFIAMLIINSLYGFWPNPLFILLIPIVLIMITFTLGLMFLTSYLSVMLRDIPELIGIILQLAFYLTPIIYPVDTIPAKYQIIFLINPLAPLIEGTRDIVAYNHTPDMLSMIYPLTVGLILLYLGYTLFKANEDYLADLI